MEISDRNVTCKITLSVETSIQNVTPTGRKGCSETDFFLLRIKLLNSSVEDILLR